VRSNSSSKENQEVRTLKTFKVKLQRPCLSVL
jgi:hypothetical protein